MKSTFVPTALVKRSPASAQPIAAAPKLPNGTRPSVHNGQLLISTGLHDLDEILGGGLAVGTLLLIEEDINTSHAKSLLKYFLSEGAACNHSVFLSSSSPHPEDFIGSLPTETSTTSQDVAPATADTKKADELKIAWQYQKYIAPKPEPRSTPTPTTTTTAPTAVRSTARKPRTRPFCHSYDLSRPIGFEAMKDKVKTLDASTLEETNKLRHLYNSIASLIAQDSSSPDSKNITRIGIHSLGSPLWGIDAEDQEGSGKALAEFLHALRGLLRSSLAVCVITFPSHLHSPAVQRKVMHLSDTVVSLHSFKGTGETVSEAFKDYSGIFQVRKLPRLNSLVSHMPDSLTYVFTMGRRKLVIETLHLPPEISRSEKPASTSTKSSGSLMCLPGEKNPLDF